MVDLGKQIPAFAGMKDIGCCQPGKAWFREPRHERPVIIRFAQRDGLVQGIKVLPGRALTLVAFKFLDPGEIM